MIWNPRTRPNPSLLFPGFLLCYQTSVLSFSPPPSPQAGTSGYMAPEILKKEPYRMSVDWWALGCSIYEMVSARLPFKDYKEKVQKEEVARRTLEDECKYEHKNFDEGTKTIIDLFLKKKIDERLGCRTK